MKTTSLAARISLMVGGVLFSLVLLELGCRLLRGGPAALVHWPNLARERMVNDDSGGCAYVDDALLGWSLPPNCRSPTYNVDADGFRAKPGQPSPTGPPLLVTGSSFAMGDEVADDETWPAYLQGLIGRKVVNAGVSGYSLDQTVLRTERLVPRVMPVVAIVSFTAGDIWRTELSVAYSREKPYFVVADGGLDLRNVPVRGLSHGPVPIPAAGRLLGQSMLAGEIVERLGIRSGWYYDEVQAVPSGTGPTISCLLMTRLAKLGVPVVVMAQYGRGVWTAEGAYRERAFRDIHTVLGCAGTAGLIPFDLAGPLKPVVAARGLDALFLTEHHTPEGNRAIAGLIQHELERRKLLSQSSDRKSELTSP